MEQRNKSFCEIEKNEYLFLDDILNRRYLIKMDNDLKLSEMGIYIRHLKGKSASTQITVLGQLCTDKNLLEKLREEKPNLFDTRNYKDMSKRHLFKILDKLLGCNSRELLKLPNRKRYLFTIQNVLFINAVLDFYECKEERIQFLERGIMGDYWQERLREGFFSLGDNPNIRLTREELEKRWEYLFFNDYNVFLSYIKDICTLIEYFVFNDSCNFDVTEILDEKMEKCSKLYSKLEQMDLEYMKNIRQGWLDIDNIF